MPVITDEGNADDEEEDEFMPMSSTTFVKPDMNRDITWDDVSSHITTISQQRMGPSKIRMKGPCENNIGKMHRIW